MRQWKQQVTGELGSSIKNEIENKFRKEKALRLEKEKKEKKPASLTVPEEAKHEPEAEKDDELINTMA